MLPAGWLASFPHLYFGIVFYVSNEGAPRNASLYQGYNPTQHSVSVIDLIIDASIPAAVGLAARNAAEAKWRGSVRKRRVGVVELANRRRHRKWVRFAQLCRPRVQTRTHECSSCSNTTKVHCGSTVDLHPLLSSCSWLSFWVSSGSCWLSGKPIYLLSVRCVTFRSEKIISWFSPTQLSLIVSGDIVINQVWRIVLWKT